ncbi:ANTAR domain-containing protein [Hyphomonas hirschiana VP5]|uniref:ANTAR domain-containing protein n=1 Tax=Hyphomonas hirschiana VP5 TaxID=1280951 RepID=A0A059FPM0_9PROT|nr:MULTISPECIES: ANTAR domain-containing protein [Hyphomonas]KCZ92589.1 ANTAR domain-containing protein [Hyphomonas hirschiana VP5]
MSDGSFNLPSTDANPASQGVYLVIAHREADRAQIMAGLPQGAIVHLAPAEENRALPAQVETVRPDMLIGACEVPDDTLLAAFRMISEASPLPVVLFTEKDRTQMAHRALAAGVSAYIVNGLTAERILPVTQVARERFRMTAALHQELRKSREELAARKVIERAKGLLMERRGMSEQAAYEAMRRLAMSKARPLREIAELILSVSDILP